MKFFRIVGTAFDSPAVAFSGLGATKASHRWSWAQSGLRAVYCSDTLSLACLEKLVHLRPALRSFPPSVYFTVDVPDGLLERPAVAALPRGWGAPVAPAAARDFGTAFLRERRAVGLVLPTAVVPVGLNVLLNPLHPEFSLKWVKGPQPFTFDQRLEAERAS